MSNTYVMLIWRPWGLILLKSLKLIWRPSLCNLVGCPHRRVNDICFSWRIHSLYSADYPRLEVYDVSCTWACVMIFPTNYVLSKNLSTFSYLSQCMINTHLDRIGSLAPIGSLGTFRPELVTMNSFRWAPNSIQRLISLKNLIQLKLCELDFL